MITPEQRAVPVAQDLHERRLTGFREAVAAVPYIAERLAIGQQFNAVDSSLNADDDADEDCTMYVCIGSFGDSRSIVSIEGRAEANMIADAMTFAAFAATASAESREVAIWSGEHRAYWRRDGRSEGANYTLNLDEAGVWTRADAVRLTSHCGPEKLIALHDRPTLCAGDTQ